MLFNLFRMSNNLLSGGSPQHKRDSLILTLSAAGQTALHLGMISIVFLFAKSIVMKSNKAVFVDCTVIPRATASMTKKAKSKKKKDDDDMDEM